MRGIKTFTVVFAATAILAVFPASADYKTVHLSASGKNTPESGIVSVRVSSDFDCTAIQGALSFDASVFSFEDAEISDGLTSYNSAQDSVTLKDNVISFGVLGNVNGGTKGDFITLNFRVVSKEQQLMRFSLQNVKAVGKSAEVCAESSDMAKLYINTLSGDINTDGSIDIKDLVRYKKYLAGSLNIGEYNEYNADNDMDEKITAADMVLEKQHLLGIIAL